MVVVGGMAMVALSEHEMVKRRVSFVSSFLLGMNDVVLCNCLCCVFEVCTEHAMVTWRDEFEALGKWMWSDDHLPHLE